MKEIKLTTTISLLYTSFICEYTYDSDTNLTSSYSPYKWSLISFIALNESSPDLGQLKLNINII